jgi:hypothetical protein
MTKSGLHIQTFDLASCKPILDEIDAVLGRYYLNPAHFELGNLISRLD